jgi:ureidoglycolate hydrolase
MGEAVTRVRAEPLNAEAWAPYGWLPRPDTDPRDGSERMSFEWGDPHVNVIGHRADEIGHRDGALVCAEMFRHDTHTQALLVLDALAVVAVAPAGARFEAPADAGAIAAFVVEPLQALVLHKGTWHWGPFPIGGAEWVHLYNVQGRRYLEDNTRVDLAAVGEVEVVVA